MTKLGVVLIAALAACPSKNSSPPPGQQPGGSPAGEAVSGGAAPGSAVSGAGSGAGAPAASGAPTAGRNMSGPRTRLAANCPAMLPGTITHLAMTARGVDVTVTARDPAVARQIVTLAQRHARGRASADAQPGVQRQPHDQQHGGPGTLGYCPIVVSDQTTVSMTPVSGGVTAHVDAISPDRVSAVQDMVKTRAVRLPGYTSS